MLVYGLTDIDGCTHLNRQGNLINHVAYVRADRAATQDASMAAGFWRIVKQQLGEAFVASIGDGAARGSPREQALLDLNALRLWLGLQLNPPMPLWKRCRPLMKSRGD